jgi:release factor glutamine methyltransferase
VSVLEARRWGARLLADLEDPGLEADLLLMHVLQWPRHRLLLEADEPLGRGEMEEYRRAVMARRRRVPLQHITGRTELMSTPLLAGPEAMVPRPETEVLLQALLDELPEAPPWLLDVGTGSGAAAVVLALHRPGWRVVATDVDRAALGLAARNAELHDLRRVSPVACDLATGVRGGFAGVAANLPYVATGEIPALQPEVRLGDPRKALDGGDDGLDLVRRLIPDLPRLLAPGGVAALETADAQTEETAELMLEAGLTDVEVIRDLAGLRRVVRGRRG